MAVAESVRLLAPGVPVVLADGLTYQLIYDMEALCEIEEGADGLQNFIAKLKLPNWRARMIRLGIVAGLRHTEMSFQEIVSKLDYKQNSARVEAITDAFIQAMPEVDPKSPNARRRRRVASRGKGSTAPHSSSGSTPGTSGA